MAEFEDDKYYVTPELLEKIWRILISVDGLRKVYEIIEPGAGKGDFIPLFKRLNKPYLCMDIKPEHPEVILKNFFDWNVSDNKMRAIIGGPPYSKSKRLSLYYDFLDHCRKNNASIICFISPGSAYKREYFKSGYRLIVSKYLGLTTFLSNQGEPHKVETCINVWVKDEEYFPESDLVDEKIEKDFQISIFRKKDKEVPAYDYYFITRGANAGKLILPENMKQKEDYLGFTINDTCDDEFYFGKKNGRLNREGCYLCFREYVNLFYNHHYHRMVSTSYAYLNIDKFKNFLRELAESSIYLMPWSLEKFQIKYSELIKKGIIKFRFFLGEFSIIIDRFDDYAILCDKNDNKYQQARTDLTKKLGYQRIGLGTYIKPKG